MHHFRKRLSRFRRKTFLLYHLPREWELLQTSLIGLQKQRERFCYSFILLLTSLQNAITGVVVPKKKPLPVPDVWPERPATTSAYAYQQTDESWEDVPFTRKLTVKERRELQRKQQEAEAMELQERQKEIDEKMMIPPDEGKFF